MVYLKVNPILFNDTYFQESIPWIKLLGSNPTQIYLEENFIFSGAYSQESILQTAAAGLHRK